MNQVDKLYFRGKRVFKAVIDDLKEKGMINAKQVLFPLYGHLGVY